MPIDTASKRRSASGVGHRIGGRGVTPNAAKPLAWRQQAGWGYSGIATGEVEEPEPGRVVCLTGADRSITTLAGADHSVTTLSADLDC